MAVSIAAASDLVRAVSCSWSGRSAVAVARSRASLSRGRQRTGAGRGLDSLALLVVVCPVVVGDACIAGAAEGDMEREGLTSKAGNVPGNLTGMMCWVSLSGQNYLPPEPRRGNWA